MMIIIIEGDADGSASKGFTNTALALLGPLFCSCIFGSP
jgi:hypothetical protein